MKLLSPLFTTAQLSMAHVRHSLFFLLVVTAALSSSISLAQAGDGTPSLPDTPSPDDTLSLDKELQSLKREALKLNRELLILKEELQFPANTQVGVFLSVDVGEFFSLDGVNVELNGKDIGAHLYTAQQLDALKRGAIQKLHVGNIKAGSHELVAVFTGRGPKGRDYRRATAYQFDKGSNAKYLELQIVDSDRLNQPEFQVKDWD